MSQCAAAYVGLISGSSVSGFTPPARDVSLFAGFTQSFGWPVRAQKRSPAVSPLVAAPGAPDWISSSTVFQASSCFRVRSSFLWMSSRSSGSQVHGLDCAEIGARSPRMPPAASSAMTAALPAVSRERLIARTGHLRKREWSGYAVAERLPHRPHMLPGTSRATRRAVVLLLLAGGLTYANAFWGVFQFDDERVILQDSRLESLARFVGHLPQMIRPVTKLTFFVDRWCLGASPAGYHLLNLLLHLANGLLVFALLRAVRLGRGLQPRPALAFWTALVFLVHPIGSEAVTYVSGRPTLLAAFFGLAALCLATGAAARQAVAARHRRRPRSRAPRHDHPAGRLPGDGPALEGDGRRLSRPPAALAPRLRAHGPGGREPHRPASPPRGVGHTGVVPVRRRPCTRATRSCSPTSLGLRGWVENLLSQAYAVAYAATLIVAPAPWRLNFDHDLPLVTSVWQWPVPLCLVSIAAVFVLAIVAARRAPVFSFGLLWFFVCLAPTNSILPRYDLLSERNLYLPSIGVFIAIVDRLAAGGARLAAALPAVNQAPRAARWLLPAAAVLLLAGITIDRNRLYADPVAFWEDAVRKSPRKARPHTNYGYALYRAGQTDRAIREFRAALAIDPDDPDAQRNLRRAWSADHEPTAAGRRE